MRGAALLLLVLLACQREPPAEESHSADAYRQPDRLIAALGLRPGEHVADIGAGGGYLTLRLARAVGPRGRVVATDIDAAALRRLDQRARAAGLSQIETRLVRPDDPGLGPDLEPERFDLVLLAQVDHLLPDRAAYLQALRRVLRPGGRIAVSNAERHQAPLLQAARQAGCAPRELRIGLPGQFLLLCY
jgi:ubiquinone/menaquinone biosynthesis C-methylase UbiE